jgi:hypothetical protein
MNNKYNFDYIYSTIDYTNISITNNDLPFNLIEKILLNIFGQDILKKTIGIKHTNSNDGDKDGDNYEKKNVGEDTDDDYDDNDDDFNVTDFMVDITDIFFENINKLDNNKKNNVLSSFKISSYSNFLNNKHITKKNDNITDSTVIIELYDDKT